MNAEVQLEICKRDLNESITYVGFQRYFFMDEGNQIVIVPSLKKVALLPC